jgi:ArsR family transcriptional regulator, arsenate/arsenite/antimonite-responsive transcriptional repressor
MESIDALACFAALSQPTRLDAFRRLVRAEPTGMPAGELARELGVPQNTLSAHLGVLANASLVFSSRKGRSIVYRAELTRINALVRFLLDDCCAGAGCAEAAPLPVPACCEPSE